MPYLLVIALQFPPWLNAWTIISFSSSGSPGRPGVFNLLDVLIIKNNLLFFLSYIVCQIFPKMSIKVPKIEKSIFFMFSFYFREQWTMNTRGSVVVLPLVPTPIIFEKNSPFCSSCVIFVSFTRIYSYRGSVFFFCGKPVPRTYWRTASKERGSGIPRDPKT